MSAHKQDFIQGRGTRVAFLLLFFTPPPPPHSESGGYFFFANTIVKSKLNHEACHQPIRPQGILIVGSVTPYTLYVALVIPRSLQLVG